MDLTHLKSPVNVTVLHKLLVESKYDKEETKFLVDGFTNGFRIGYEGPRNIKLTSQNLKLDGKVGNKTDLWNKMMKEVKEGRYAGPFKDPPFKHFIQSPVGLVPKDGGKSSRLIFHLSYPRKPKGETQSSVNANTPKEYTTVSYPTFESAVQLCIEIW